MQTSEAGSGEFHRRNAALFPVAVIRTFDYDALDRAIEETMDADAGTIYTTSSVWTPTVRGWERDVFSPSGTSILRGIDRAGRLDFLEVIDESGGARGIDFDWVGGIYAGREHVWTTDPSIDPIRQEVDHDGLGRATRLAYTALDFVGSTPRSTSWADAYCGGSYDPADCSAPLFEQTLARDVLGRARSVQTMWGNPDGGLLATRPVPWRGYEYDAEGRLTVVYEHEGALDPVEPSALGAHSITNDEVADFVARLPSTEPALAVDWIREPDVGALLAIEPRGASPDIRWEHRTTAGPQPVRGPRLAGHRLDAVRFDNDTHAVTHDAQGRVTSVSGKTFHYGPRGRLYKVASTTGVDEDYAYDAAGRLAKIVDGKNRTIVYDGDQMLAAMDAASGRPRWEALWGTPDQLLEFRDHDAFRHYVALTDHRNSVVGWWDVDDQAMAHLIEYTPLGRVKLHAPDGSVRCEEEGTGRDCVRQWGLPFFGFASAYRSDRSGVVHMRNRWYDPTLGQFLSHDPLGYLDSYNLYTYAAHDPINMWDPYGLGSSGTSEQSAFQQRLMASVDATSDFGNDCGPGKDCFDTSQSDPIRAVGVVRGAATGAENAAKRAGDANRALTNDARSFYRNEFDRSSGLGAIGPGLGFIGADVWGMLTPQSGDEVMLELAMGPLGRGLKGATLADDIFKLRRVDAAGIGSHRGAFLPSETRRADQLFNPSRSRVNCVAATCAAVDARLNAWDFNEVMTADDFPQLLGGRNLTHSQAIAGLEEALDVTLGPHRPGEFISSPEPGTFVVFGLNSSGTTGHTVLGEILPDGSRVLFDPQAGKHLSWEMMSRPYFRVSVHRVLE